MKMMMTSVSTLQGHPFLSDVLQLVYSFSMDWMMKSLFQACPPQSLDMMVAWTCWLVLCWYRAVVMMFLWLNLVDLVITVLFQAFPAQFLGMMVACTCWLLL